MAKSKVRSKMIQRRKSIANLNTRRRKRAHLVILIEYNDTISEVFLVFLHEGSIEDLSVG